LGGIPPLIIEKSQILTEASVPKLKEFEDEEDLYEFDSAPQKVMSPNTAGDVTPVTSNVANSSTGDRSRTRSRSNISTSSSTSAIFVDSTKVAKL
jgi:hypothetical protein